MVYILLFEGKLHSNDHDEFMSCKVDILGGGDKCKSMAHINQGLRPASILTFFG